MKTLIVVTAGLLAIGIALTMCNFLFGFGLGVYRLPAPSERFHAIGGVATDPNRKYAVNIEKMIPYMRDARWTSEHFLWKLPVNVVLDDGERFKIDALGCFFQVEGVRGTFYFEGKSEDKFRFACHDIIHPY